MGKPPLHLLSVMQVSTLTGFAENELIEWGRTFSGFYGSENSVSGMWELKIKRFTPQQVKQMCQFISG